MSEQAALQQPPLLEDDIIRRQEQLGEYQPEWKRILSHLVRSRSAQLGGVLVIVFLLAALLGPVILPYDATTDSNLAAKLQPPSAEHIMGTDNLGRDIAIRILHGARVSLTVSIVSVSISLLIGVFHGELAGFTGGVVDSIIMRLMDILLAFPGLLLAIVIVAFIGPGLRNAMIAIGVIGIPAYARLSRSMAISIREEEYVEATRALGASPWRNLFRHVIPNSLAPIIVQTTLSLGTAVIETAALGFLGLGQQPPFPEWGKMLAESQRFLLTGSWWALVFPGLAIVMTVLGFNLLGDGLRDVLDPRMKQSTGS